ncbi:tetratricopeptide repeat protein [Bradyrhizobium sp.]|uniref:tetratricopeptide repeat protein n=1 Tax=Bradyrhizobium sp. TaxID=376 RepID=UPI003C5FAA2D
MIRSILAAVCAVLFAANLHAAGLDDLKAAKAAADQGSGDDAVRLFTSAISAGDLSADDQFAARTGRAGQYSAQSLVADAFDRRDDGRRLRENAIADFTAALALKAGDAGVLTERGQDYHMNQQFDAAVADFTAALQIDRSPGTLLQRASSLRAKGAYDDAIADCTAALGMEMRDGLEPMDIYNERGYTEFLGARYDAAAADFDKALTLGATARADDVLWLPYQIVWLHLARARAGQKDLDQLQSLSEKVNLKQWPGTLVAYFLGQVQLTDVSGPSSHGMMGRARECNMSLFAGEDALAKGDHERASELIGRAHEMCSAHTFQALVASTEFDRLKK